MEDEPALVATFSRIVTSMERESSTIRLTLMRISWHLSGILGIKEGVGKVSLKGGKAEDPPQVAGQPISGRLLNPVRNRKRGRPDTEPQMSRRRRCAYDSWQLGR